MKNLSTKRNSALGVLCLVILEVTIVLAYFLANKSEPGSSILFGYSLPKIGLISVLLMLEVLLLAAIVILAFRITRGYETFRRVYRFLQVESYRQLLIFLLVLAILLLSGYYLSGFLVRAELSGTNNAEVGRLWLFLNPLIALVISFWVTEFEEPTRKRVLIGYVALQLSLAYLFNFAFFGPTSL